MSIPPSQYPESFKDDIFVNFCHNASSPTESIQHFHNYHYELCFVLKGKATFYYDFETTELSPGKVLFLNKKTTHLSIEDKTMDCERIIINFNDRFLRKFSLNQHFLKQIFATPLLDIPQNHKDDLDKLLTELVYESDYPSSFSTHLVNGNVYKLLVTIYRIVTNTHLEKILPTNPIIETASKFICQNYNNAITLDDVANYCHVNKCYLSKLFKNIMGVNFINYVNSIRIQNASIMLLDTGKSISEIADLCGFNSQNHFCEVFKKMKGVSARDFRKSK